MTLDEPQAPQDGWLARLWPARAVGRPLPLVVDLDGALFRRGPAAAVIRDAALRRPDILVPAWLRAGRGRADRLSAELIAWRPAAAVAIGLDLGTRDAMRLQARMGGEVVAVSSAGQAAAAGCLAAAGIDARLYASDAATLLTPARKARLLTALFGPHGFVYLGGGAGHWPVCMAARRSVMTEVPPGFQAAMTTRGCKTYRRAAGPIQAIALRLADLAAAGASCERLDRLVSRRLWLQEWEEAQGRRGEADELSDARRVERRG